MYKYSYLLLSIFFIQCYSAPKVAGQFTVQEFEDMATQMAKGTVKDMTITQLIQEKEDVLLLDARERNEYEISHIPTAIWVGYDDFTLDRVKAIAKDQAVVTYCSVGYRSERIGEQLQKAGFENVRNLKGSIFQWVNEGQPVVDGEAQPTTKVHGFNEKWGKWVKKGEVVY